MKPTTIRTVGALLVLAFLSIAGLCDQAAAQRVATGGGGIRGSGGSGGGEGGLAGSGIPLMTTRLVVNSGLVRPIFATFAPGDPTRLFIIEKRGLIRILKIDVNPPVLLPTPFLDIDSVTVNGTSQGNEQGLLGLAFHPNYQQNGYFFVYYTASRPSPIFYSNTVARYQRSANPDVANGSNTTGVTILDIDDPETNHNGGWIAFKPGDTQGHLYVSTGDGGGGGDLHGTLGNGQNLDVLLGKMLRIDIDGPDNIVGNGDDDGYAADAQRNYAIPPSNPFVGIAGDDAIWNYGLRNAWRPSFDRVTGDLYIADVGQNAYEEINFQRTNSIGGENYGWRCMEGNHCTGWTGCTCEVGCSGGPLTCPVFEYDHTTLVCAITGGYLYRGTRMPTLQGTYFFADYNCSFVGEAPIWSLKFTDGVPSNYTDRTAELDPDGIGVGLTIDTLTSFGEDYYGELYICDQEGGEVFKIVPRCAPDINFDGTVNVTDLLAVIGTWGPCPLPGCPSDTNLDGNVNVTDLLAVIGVWGPCP